MGFTPELLLPVLRAYPPTPCYWVAYSGGLDSSVLLHALTALRSRLDAPLKALHLDHGLQAGSAAWSTHCERVCERLEVPLVRRRLQVDLPPGTSLEAEARDARRDAFRSVLGPDELMLTAQHRDDQAETLLLQLLRGSGLNGLAAMPELTKLAPGYLARPLLNFARVELEAYARDQGIGWVDDPSNAGTAFDRNYLRHQVLPRIAERWPAYAATVSRSARHCAEGQGLIDHLAEREYAAVQGERDGSLDISALVRTEPALCRALLRRWIRRQGFGVPGSRHLDRILREVLTAAPDRSPLVAWQGAQVRRYREGLYIMPPLPKPPARDIPWVDDGLKLPPGLGCLKLTGEVPKPGLKVRFGITGVRCRRPDQAHAQTLKKLYQQQGVPDWVRPYVPLLYRDDTLLAVAGLWVCQEAQIQGLVWEGHPFQAFMT